MPNIVGGRRSRFIKDSMELLVESVLQSRGWLDAGRQHAPITLIPAPQEYDEEIAFNTIAVSSSDTEGSSAEMGSNLEDDNWQFFIDFYGENEDIAMDVIYDIRDALRGKIPSIGRTRPILSVYDFEQATPPVIFICDIEDVVVDRAQNFTNPWQRYWFSISCIVVDTYGDENDTPWGDSWDVVAPTETENSVARLLKTTNFENLSQIPKILDPSSGSISQSNPSWYMNISGGSSPTGGAAIYDDTWIASPVYDFNPSIQFLAYFLTLAGGNGFVVFGGLGDSVGGPDQIIPATLKHFGFLFTTDGSTTQVRGSVTNGTTTSTSDWITLEDLGGDRVFYAQMTSGEKVDFYIDGELLFTVTDSLPTGDLALGLWGAGVRNTVAFGSEMGLENVGVSFDIQ